MSTPVERFAFVDSVHAAEFLHTTQEAVLDMIAAGRLRPFGGKPGNPFLRSADVLALAEQLHVPEDEAPRRTKSGSARVQARLTSDARWAEIGEGEIGEWVSRADGTRRAAARTTAQLASQRLSMLLQALDAAEAGSSG